MVDPRLDRAIDGFDEVLTVIPQVETQKVVAEQTVQELFLPGENAKRLAVRPGYVPELRDDQIGISLLEIARQEAQMVILNEYESRPAVGFFEHRIAE